ncbi:hypothetical protein GQ54DRAFT_290987 [Martensiomyces pterosporus]|nr:hypothetical protein GQ54DRAFT_290987 [Martensiomyces pterosporus]
MHAEFVCGDRFADNFWSRDDRCISVLMHKLKNAKQTCNDILHVITARASLEEELGKKMLKISRASLGSEELGTIKDALRSVRAEMESTAKTHLELGKQLRTELEKPLTGFMDAQRQKRRAQTTVIQKTEGDRNTLRSQLRKLQDKRRSDTKKVGDLELQVNGLHGMGDPKLKAKLERAQAQQRATEKEYVDVRARLKDADQQWLHVWRSACDVFQVLEEERIDYLKNCLWTYTNLVSSACVADDEAMEKIRQDLEKICVADDIAEFIKTFGTGPPDPELGSSSARTSTAQGTIASHHNAPVDYPTQSSAATGPSGTTRSSTMPMQASAAATRPPTQASVHQPRPASMHAAAGMAASPAMQGQPQQMANGDVMWNSRPASSMQGTFNDNSHYRRASNNDIGAVYRSATPVQQSPQYMANVMSRPPTQMSHSPVPHSHGGYPMAAAAPSPQPHQRTPSVAGSYQAPSQMQQRASSSSADPQSGDSSNKEILFYVRALYDYDAEAETELSIRDGDVISVLSVSPDGWWEGELTDRATGQPRRGTFPSNFTDPISNLTAG